jgi:hypothetical protein
MNPGGGFGPVVITQADARQLPLPDESVDLIVTSPPFLNLRSYQDGGAHMEHQIGAGTREEFLAQLWEVTAEMRRVLKPAGSLFVELGDSYTDKCLNMTPHRYAIGCVDRLGLILRAEVVWSRPNGLPESVTDRVRRGHSMLFHFVKQPRYYAAVDEIRESSTDSNSSRKRARDEWDGTGALREAKPYGGRPTEVAHRGVPGVGTQFMGNPLGKLPGSVWGIPTAPLTVPKWLGVDHFAAMAPEVARRVVLGWSPREVCTGCGEGRRPVTEGTPIPGWIRRTPGSRQMSSPGGARVRTGRPGRQSRQRSHDHRLRLRLLRSRRTHRPRCDLGSVRGRRDKRAGRVVFRAGRDQQRPVRRLWPVGEVENHGPGGACPGVGRGEAGSGRWPVSSACSTGSSDDRTPGDAARVARRARVADGAGPAAGRGRRRRPG